MMKSLPSSAFPLLVVIFGLFAGPVFAKPGPDDIPAQRVEELAGALRASQQEDGSAARKRLAVKRVLRDAQKLLEAHPEAPNRFEVLGLLFRAQRDLFGLDDSTRNREALLKTAERLVKAPDAFASQRLDADLLHTQTRLARQSAGAEERLAALNEMVGRYRDTPGDARMLQTAMVMALELGDSRLVRDLRQEMAERFASDLDMIQFQSEKLGGQVFGAPFCGLFQRSDGGTMHLPADGLGRNLFLYFWSQEDFGRKDLEALAAYWKEHREELAGRVHLISFNVDELPDAGEGILRELGVEWPALHLPDGRENPRYQIFAKRDTALISLTPTGYSAIVMSGATRRRKGETAGVRDFDRWFQSLLAREWTRERYINQLTSLFAGDFFIIDPEGPFDPARPPEIKALGEERCRNFESGPGSLSPDKWQEIQACFTPPPLRYRMTLADIRGKYQRAEKLCRQLIAAHPEAPDLWMARNRRLVALLGLWKMSADHSYFEEAVAGAQTALQADMPEGAGVVPRWILAKHALRDPAVDHRAVIARLLEELGGEDAPGPALAAAAMLALDVADRRLHEKYRTLILDRHVEEPMMWTFVSFLLDRHHRYWLYRVPFTAGWSYGRRSQVFMSRGDPDEVARTVKAEFQALDGKARQIPGDGEGKWQVVLLTQAWDDPGKAPIYATVDRYLRPWCEKRGLDDVRIIVAVIGGDSSEIRKMLEKKPLEAEVVMVPGGVAHPLVKQVGVTDEDQRSNALVLRPDGKVAIFLSAHTLTRAKGQAIANVIEWHDRRKVEDLLEAGKVAEAREFILALAPVFDPEAVDERGRKLKKPVIDPSHLRARARVYLAMGEYDKALADAEEVAQEQMRVEGWMSLRTNQLDEDEAFRDEVKMKAEAASR